jgi:hypothetical protein
MSKGIGICDTGRHLIGLESPTYSKVKFQRSAGLASKIRQFYHAETAKKGTR